MSDVLAKPIIHELTGVVAELAAAARGAGTVRAYRSQWGQFVQWCAGNDCDPYGGEHVIVLNVAAAVAAGLSPSTIKVRVAAITHEYEKVDLDLRKNSPMLRVVMKGVRRKLGTAPRRQAAPIRPDQLRAMLRAPRCPSTAGGARDRALLLLGFGAFQRRSEITGLHIGDVVQDGPGLLVTFRSSKTDQEGEGQTVGVYANPADPELCPLLAWLNWLNHRCAADDMAVDADHQDDRPLFCSVRKDGWIDGEPLGSHYVSAIIKQAAEDAGFDPEDFSAHSLRRGAATFAAENDINPVDLAKQMRHRDLRMPLLYTSRAKIWSNKASAAALGVRT